MVLPESSISALDVWKPSSADLTTKWQNCENLECNLDIMEKDGAATGARDFVKLLPEKGYLSEFKEMGKIDLGKVTFPDRVNSNEEYYLLNGFPVAVSSFVSNERVTIYIGEPGSTMEKDPLYLEMKAKYPKIELEGTAREFIGKNTLPDNNEEYIFKYLFVSDCRICETEYSGLISFIFHPSGDFMSINFVQINKTQN